MLAICIYLYLHTTALAQTTIWSEDFNAYVNGTTSGTGTGSSPVNWTTDPGAAVTGGLILASNTSNAAGSSLASPLVWITNPMDISAYTDVTLQVDVGAYDINNFEDSGGSQDNFTLEYRINGAAGIWVTLVSASGSPAQPINPNYTVIGLSGNSLEIRAEFHNTASNENYTLDNILVQGVAETDSDGDGIQDQIDLDNDNDGIPDVDELTTIDSNSQPPCGGETILDFSAPATLESGSGLTEGAVYRIPSITTGTDALVTIERTFNASVTNIDNNSADPESFKPQTAFNFPSVGDQGYIEYKIQFVTTTGSSPVVIPRFFMNFNDIDGGANYAEQNWADNPSTYTTSNPTELTMTTDGSWVIGTAGPNDYSGASNANPEVNFSVNYNSKSEIRIRVGAVARVAGASSGGRQHAIEFACVTNYVNPVTYGIDTDSDGVANHLDLDADNDGIYDAVEAGHGINHLNGEVISVFGGNGLADLAESSPDSGTLNYGIRNTDALPPGDYLDLDSDEDGCSDANEAYGNANADAGDNFYYGTGEPPLVDSKGRVVGAAYTVPADNGSNGTPDHMENLQPSIITNPSDVTTCLGCNAQFSIAANDEDSYQWQLFDGISWIDILDSGIYSGSGTNTLSISSVGSQERDTNYRVLLYNSNYSCGPLISSQALLTITVNSIISNRRITYRLNRN